MGIRLHKFLGYGITGLQVKDDSFQIDDARINPSSPVFDYRSLDIDDYSAWLQENSVAETIDLDAYALQNRDGQDADKEKFILENCWAWSPEYGEADAICFRPLSQSRWSRSNDPIDGVIEQLDHGDEAKNRVEFLNYGLYPWSGLYMDLLTGEQIDHSIMNWIRVRNSEQNDSQEVLDALARSCGFADHGDAETRVIPYIPEEIRNLVNYLEVFTSEDGWKDLRPMLYTYWS